MLWQRWHLALTTVSASQKGTSCVAPSAPPLAGAPPSSGNGPPRRSSVGFSLAQATARPNISTPLASELRSTLERYPPSAHAAKGNGASQRLLVSRRFMSRVDQPQLGLRPPVLTGAWDKRSDYRRLRRAGSAWPC